MAIKLGTLKKPTKDAPRRVVVYGVGGVGKTTLAHTAPAPFFIQTEEGDGNLKLNSFGICESYDDVAQQVKWLLTEDHKYKTVVVDGLTRLEPLLWQRVIDTRPVDDKGREVTDIEGYGFGKGYTYATAEWRHLLRGFDKLRSERGMNVILIAHDTVKKHEPPDSESFDRYEPRLHRKAADAVKEWCDALLFVTYKTYTVKEDEGFGNQRTRAVGEGDRVIYTEQRPAFEAKNRDSLPPELPLKTWKDLTENINKEGK